MRFIRGHELVHVLSLVDTSSDGLNIYLALVCADLLGVGFWGGFSSHMFTPNFWHVCNMLIGCFVLQCIPHLGYLLMLASHPYPIWKLYWGLRSVLEGIFCLRRFWRGFQGCQRLFLIVTARDGLFVPYDIHGGLSSCLQVYDRLNASLLSLMWALACTSVPCFIGGSPKFLEGLLHDCKQRPNKSYPCLMSL